MKYKIGDKVKVKSLEWYKSMDKDYFGAVGGEDIKFIADMVRYCGKDAIVVGCYTNSYELDIDEGDWSWYDWMLEDGFEVQKDKDLIPKVLNAESLEEKRFQAACSAINGIVSVLMQSEEWYGWTEKYIAERAYLLADELLKQGGFTE